MPSQKNPANVVNPGPGRLAASTVTDSAFIFGGGGSGAALHAHIIDPMDAHMASAIGINPTDTVTGQHILSTAGGTVDGESVFDFIVAAKDLWPDPPDQIGWDRPDVPNSGRPIWGTLDEVGTGLGEAVTGGFVRGSNVVFSHHIIPITTVNPVVYGMVYPADRGVLALYWTPNGNFSDPGTTLLAALWLGSTTCPAGIPNANFLETQRATSQADHTPTGVGLDNIALMSRVPYLKDYSSYIVNWLPFDFNFLRYQIALYVKVPDLTIVGDAGSWLWVHWRESYATSLAAIQPMVLMANLVTANCYSAVPTMGDFDSGPVRHVNRHNVFRDASSATVPGGTIVSNVSGGPPTPTYVHLSGVGHYNGLNLRVDFTVTVTNLWKDSFYTATSLHPPDVPVGMESPYAPLEVSFADFADSASPLLFGYYQMRQVGSLVNYGVANPPLAEHTSECVVSNYALSCVSGYTPPLGEAQIRTTLRKPYQVVTITDTLKYMFNSWNQVGATRSTGTFEDFVDEKYRYVSTKVPNVSGTPLLPAGVDDFDSTVPFTGGGPDAQVVGSSLIYPQTNYSVGYASVGPNYAAVFAADPANHMRRYLRAFDTGSPRVTGKIRIRGLAWTNFQATVAYTGNEVTDHPGGAIIQIRVAGSTEWLDLGRAKGDPDLLLTDFRGCQTGLDISGPDVIVTYDTTLPTADDGTGKYPIFVRITLIKGPGTTLKVDELEWLAP
jgi:hypothetical protein